MPRATEPGEWLQFNLSRPCLIAGLRILRRGDPNPGQAVRRVDICASPDNPDPPLFTTLDAIQGEEEAADLIFAEPVEARYLRVKVQAFDGAICMRAGLYMAGPPPGYTPL